MRNTSPGPSQACASIFPLQLSCPHQNTLTHGDREQLTAPKLRHNRLRHTVLRAGLLHAILTPSVYAVKQLLSWAINETCCYVSNKKRHILNKHCTYPMWHPSGSAEWMFHALWLHQTFDFLGQCSRNTSVWSKYNDMNAKETDKSNETDMLSAILDPPLHLTTEKSA